MTDLSLPLPPVDASANRQKELGLRAASVKSQEQARELAQEFERMFLSQMLQPLFAGLQTDGPFGGGAAEEMFRPMLLDQYAGAIAGRGGVGVADAVYREILKLQGLE